MKNEPVAWGMTWKDGEIYDVISPAQHAKEEGDYTIPLYTHPVEEQDESFDRTASHMAGEYVSYPVKKLTDDEILQIWKEFDENDADNWFIAVARAILRKAQE